MGLETRGVLAQDCPEFSPRALCAVCTIISHAVRRQEGVIRYINVRKDAQTLSYQFTQLMTTIA
jgi:hypothetical protein